MPSSWQTANKRLSYTGARVLTEEQVQVWNRLCADSTIASKFPMYVMPVAEVLRLDELRPFEEVKDRLVEWTPGMGKVLFCSHTWLRYTHPDDEKKSKLKMLKAVLTKIRAKTIGDLPFLAAYYDPVHITGKQLHRDLSDGFVWFDMLSSAPHPTSRGSMNLHALSTTRLRSLGLVCAVPQSDPVKMALAVSSIVRYVSDSSYFFVLAGPWRHENGTIRDERSWGHRGWCRMEVCANALSPASKPVVMCRSEHSLSVLPQGGMVKKSALFHTVGTGAFTVESDRLVLGGVLNELLRVRKAFALEVGDLVMFRILNAATGKLLQGGMGVPPPPVEPYDAWLATMKFEGVDLAAEGADTGLTPLRYAVMSNRPDIVCRLLQDEKQRVAGGAGGAASAKNLRPSGVPAAFVEAPLQFSVPLIEGPKAQSILMAACAWYDSAELVASLVDHDADICAIDQGVGHSPPIYAAGNENMASLQELIDRGRSFKGLRIDAWHGSPVSTPDPECERVAPHTGPMIMFAEYGCLDGLKTLALRYPDSFRSSLADHAKFGMGINIMTHGTAVSGDYHMIEWLCQQGEAMGFDCANLHSPPTDPRLKRVFKVFFILHRLMKRPPTIVAFFLQILGTTPLHCACVTGNLGVVELLVSYGAHIDSPTHLLGRTPLICAVINGHENIVRRLLELGASPSAKDTRNKRTPVQWAQRTGKQEIAALLAAQSQAGKTLAPPADVPHGAPKGASRKYQVAVAPE